MGETIARILLAAPASGSGKTTLTCALLEALRRRGKHPVSFKCGPDYIDPMFHRSVQQVPSWNLDSYFTSPDMLCSLFQEHARRGDVAVLEGVMGYYDGIRGTDGRASTFEIASLTDTPVILVVNGQNRDETVMQQICRIMDHRNDHHIAGILLNRMDPRRKEEQEEIRRTCPVPVLGEIPDRPELAVPSRHLGLYQPQENQKISEWIGRMADLLEQYADVDRILEIAGKAAEWKTVEEPEFPMPEKRIPVRLAIARDEAFSFCYKENEELLQRMGAELIPFSPLHDPGFPEDADGVLLPGGYPELWGKELAANEAMKQTLRERIAEGLPVIAECGGFLYLQNTMQAEGQDYRMTGVFPGTGIRKERLVRFGYMEAEVCAGGIFGKKGTVLRGHEFHYLDTDCNGTDLLCRKTSTGQEYRAGFCTETMYAGFPHFYFYSCPDAAAEFIRTCQRYRIKKEVQTRWDTMGKPIDGLGKLERILTRVAVAQVRKDPRTRPGALVVFCSDHGVTEEGVTQTSSEVTRIVADNCAAGRSTVNILARRTGTEVFVIDVGMNGPEYPEKELRPGTVVSRRIRNGTGNIAKESAMTKEECRQAMETGREVLCRIKELGYSIVSLGEMGIGNTTPTAVLAGLLLEMDAPEVTGYGAGLSREGLDRKIRAVQKAMDRIRAKQDLSEETMLREGGGMELAAMTGLLLEAEAQNVPVVLDGAITLAAALVAVRMDPRVRRILIASHDPQEPAGHRILEKLALPAVIRGDLSLGEGTGAMLLMPMLEAVQDVYESMGSFEEIRVEPYERYYKGETLC